MAASTASMTFSEENLPKDIWLLRPCELYKEEYADCKSLHGRFQQYYVYGENQDCSKWKQDYENCVNFRATLSPEVAEPILENERKRREDRLAGARGNNVWEYRRHPPPEWRAPIPNEKEETVLAKVQEVRESRGTSSQPDRRSMCVIS